ncbi:MAG: crossover junction endodeoxyribonuclease RuvC [Deltaproteobacteria bacterium]|nr:crossover junction endodeoxyribonuclease RuvC [Deltaproteobacteria bacterium]
MIVMGIDPGLASTGLAVVTGDSLRVAAYSFGVVRTAASTATSLRLLHIFEEIRAAVEAKKPDLIVVEGVYTLSRHPKSSILLGKATGAIMAAGAFCGVSVEEVAVREAKKVLTGNGSATKEQLELAVRSRLGRTEAIRPSHASDALALALVGLYRGLSPFSRKSP